MRAESADEYRVYLWISGFEDADDVTRLVGIEPSRVVANDSGSTPRSQVCEYGPVEYSADSIPKQLEALFRTLNASFAGFSKASRKYDAGVNCVAYLRGECNPTLAISAEQVAALARLGLSIDFDVYFLGD